MKNIATTLALSCFLVQLVACAYTKTLPVDDELASSAPEVAREDGLRITGYATRDGVVHGFKGNVTAEGDEFLFRPVTHRDVRAGDEVSGEPFRMPRSEVIRFMVSAIHVGRTVGLGLGIVTVVWATLFVAANSDNEGWD